VDASKSVSASRNGDGGTKVWGKDRCTDAGKGSGRRREFAARALTGLLKPPDVDGRHMTSRATIITVVYGGTDDGRNKSENLEHWAKQRQSGMLGARQVAEEANAKTLAIPACILSLVQDWLPIARLVVCRRALGYIIAVRRVYNIRHLGSH
jgi:hypothetical protein